MLMKSAVVWGVLACAAFYGLIYGGPLDLPVMHRYFTHHPVEFGETFLFFVGMSELVLRLHDIVVQRAAMRGAALRLTDGDDLPLDEQCETILVDLDRQPVHRREDYYIGRMRDAVSHIRRVGSTQGLSDELKYLAEADGTRSHGRYGLFRVIIWAIPILGFLGTVIGITLALNGIDPKAPDESMLRVITGLGLKFDTTAVALSFSMVMMFTWFFVDRAESALLAKVDRKVEHDLAERFSMIPVGADGQVAAMRRMAEVMVGATDRLIERQAALWQASLDAAAQRWTTMADSAGMQLVRGLDESLERHSQLIVANEDSVSEAGRKHWDKIAAVQMQHVQALATMQKSLGSQAETLERVLVATAEVVKLEDALNDNLSALSGSRNFEQTVLGLAAAIHLLNARLSDSIGGTNAVQPTTTRRTSKAA